MYDTDDIVHLGFALVNDVSLEIRFYTLTNYNIYTFDHKSYDDSTWNLCKELICSNDYSNRIIALEILKNNKKIT